MDIWDLVVLMFKKKEIQRFWPFYVDSFILKLFHFLPVFLVIYFHHLNFSFFQIGLLTAAAPLFTLIFEIPTGAIADVFGRKFSVLIGYLLEGSIIFSIYFVKDFYMLILLFAIWGIATTLSSGAKEAWIVDSVGKDKKLIHDFFHKSKFLENFGWFISGIIGAILVKSLGVAIIWPITAFAFLISFIVLLIPKNVKPLKARKKKSLSILVKQTKDTLKFGYKHHILYFSLIATFLFVVAASFSSGLTWIPFLEQTGFSIHYLGYFWSLIAIATMFSPFISKKFLEPGKEKKFIIISLVVSFFVGILALLPKEWIFALVVIVILEFFIQLRAPATKIYFHKFVPSRFRSTLTSVRSMVISLGLIIATPIIGLIVDNLGGKITFFLYAPLVIPVIIVYALIKEKKLKSIKSKGPRGKYHKVITEDFEHVDPVEKTAREILGDQIND